MSVPNVVKSGGLKRERYKGAARGEALLNNVGFGFVIFLEDGDDA